MDRRPEYLPAAVWRFYRELAERDLINDRDRGQIARLFGPDMARTWRNLARQIRTEMDWRHLFDLLLQLRLTFNAGARDAMSRADELLPEIAQAAETLAAGLREYQSLRERHEISAPPEFYHLGELIAVTLYGRGDSLDPDTLPDEDVSLINTATLIDELANSAWLHEPKCFNETSTHVRDRKHSHVTAWVRHFDALWPRWQRHMAARFTVSNTDLARIASAVLRMDVSREAVKVTRERARAEPQDEAELFTPD